MTTTPLLSRDVEDPTPMHPKRVENTARMAGRIIATARRMATLGLLGEVGSGEAACLRRLFSDPDMDDVRAEVLAATPDGKGGFYEKASPEVWDMVCAILVGLTGLPNPPKRTVR